MGFTTGFTSGVTLTLGIAYLTVLAHERNRNAQGENLRSQSSLLNTLLLSDPSLTYSAPDLETGRTSRATLVETAKDRWNAEIQNAVRWVQGAEWGNVKEGMEGAVAKALGTGLEKSREEIQLAEDKAGPIAREAIERARHGAKMGFDGSRVAAERAASRALSATSERESKFEGKTEHGLENASATAKEAWRKGVEKSHEVAERLRLGEESAAHAARRQWEKSTEAAHEIGKREGIYGDKAEHGLENAGPVAREAWRKGVEKGREIEKGLRLTETVAEHAVRAAAHHEAAKASEVAEGLKLTEEGVVGAVKRTVARGKEVVESAIGRTSGHEEADGLTDVQRALKQRYDAASPLNKSVREALAERYTPVDQKSNSNLRGL
ncbi:hypothetical protein VC83_03683 [Pseudogymnoascus destructans]|uniref:MICOS complex subunit MIC12 n=2 Tax=Pseudogymnoascus destructans TaxID=655981 RepID=L8G302_PSED2|nr:uncharacterized protein VC83_03683 [Pseudogymnoascus destructans]ELR07605.1 hypothetical protein GMDG_02653 [Pseudogymnoascus destructans 20631-21]OAF59605.1 hypothetical protein VC83_03683 [Pseudogymnoascus destructans]